MILNSIIIALLLVSISLSAIDFQILKIEIDDVIESNKKYLYSEKRNLKFIELSSNVRSYINIANGLEFNTFDLPGLNRIEDRFILLNTMI